MSRATTNRGRPVLVWLAVTAAACTAAGGVPDAWGALGDGRGSDGVQTVLVAVCTAGLALALAWLWVITTVAVVGLLTGRAGSGGATKRLVLMACGAAVVAAGSGVPAVAAGGDGPELLVGLTLPERAVAPSRQQHRPPEPPELPVSASPTSPGIHVVRRGDSLWSIALAHPDGSDVDSRWRAIWHANHHVVGDDPDLVIPGQVLRLPTLPSTPDPSPDGDRS